MSDSSDAFRLTPLSYTLPLLHAARHLSSSVLGVFLARASGSLTIIEDAIPLIHHHTSLSPMAELALEMAEVYADGKGLRLVGMYVAHESGTALGRVGERVLSALKERSEGAFALVVDNTKLGAGEVPYILYLASSPSKPVPLARTTFIPTSPSDLPALALRSIREDGAHKGLNDFDDHLEDARLDWLDNSGVKEVLRRRFA